MIISFYFKCNSYYLSLLGIFVNQKIEPGRFQPSVDWFSLTFKLGFFHSYCHSKYFFPLSQVHLNQGCSWRFILVVHVCRGDAAGPFCQDGLSLEGVN